MKIFFKSWFVWLIAFWMSSFDNYDNYQISRKLAQRQPFVFAFYSKFFPFLETKMVLKIQNETFLRITRYIPTRPYPCHLWQFATNIPSPTNRVFFLLISVHARECKGQGTWCARSRDNRLCACVRFPHMEGGSENAALRLRHTQTSLPYSTFCTKEQQGQIPAMRCV